MPIDKTKPNPSAAAQNISSAIKSEQLRLKLNRNQGRGVSDWDVPLMDEYGRLRAPEKSLPELINDELDMARAFVPKMLRGNLKGAFDEYYKVLVDRYRFDDTPANRQAVRDQLNKKGTQQEGDIDLPNEKTRRNNLQKNTLGNLLNNK